jgi:hypothetical protein
MAHPGEIATLIHERYAPAVSRDFQLFAARQMQSLIRADMVEIGYMNKGAGNTSPKPTRASACCRRISTLPAFCMLPTAAPTWKACVPTWA